VATSGEKTWPPVGKFVAASGEKPMAIDTRGVLTASRAHEGRCTNCGPEPPPELPPVAGMFNHWRSDFDQLVEQG
jgi:hypothetical protein